MTGSPIRRTFLTVLPLALLGLPIAWISKPAAMVTTAAPPMEELEGAGYRCDMSLQTTGDFSEARLIVGDEVLVWKAGEEEKEIELKLDEHHSVEFRLEVDWAEEVLKGAIQLTWTPDYLTEKKSFFWVESSDVFQGLVKWDGEEFQKRDE